MSIRRLSATVAFIFATGLANAQQAASAPVPSAAGFAGKWVVTDVVSYAPISTGIPGAKQILGKVLAISPTRIEFNHQACTPHDGFVVSEVDSAIKLKELYNVYPPDVGLPARTTLLDSANCTAVFRMADNRVAFAWNGVMVRAIHKP
ncbi:hypothetical protein BCh11DRAFT_01666 [Burkholderia sp. Ch1-1]|uniref:Uncharacterized protein n=1 Tax=Paraburkholderia dioscoreae TaxID=2604047 RepID=A0A5Q4YXQ3_9BURK|nr:MULTISPECIES: hypothetical protein [Paraburkholderia]EIF33876.1 hypothetical protein BCh11DRAFT_01666 [Burkholderia sp. Ch1-1]MDR8396270.1 hypothetical protein [Paraburkholderia sp. USG1]VVD32772.1 conserved exported protein of unknown function [Paraburkholderia dioscoreae]